MIIFPDSEGGKIEYEVVADALKAMVETLAKKHKSDTPIHVKAMRPRTVWFMDLQVPTKVPVAELTLNSDSRGRMLYTVESKRIKNDKFSVHSSGYTTRTSISGAAIQKVLARYVTPYAPQEIAGMSAAKVRNAHLMWKVEPHKALQLDVLVAGNMKTLMEEVRNLVAQGVVFATEPFKALGTTGVDLYTQKLFRESTSDKYTMAFFNLDGRVTVVHPNSGTSLVAGVGDLPADMQQNISMLRLMEPEQFVPGVGYRVNEQTFWVAS